MAENSTMRFSLMIAFFGCLSFILGVIAEHKKPKFGTPIKSSSSTITCQFPHDPTVALGILSVLALAASCVAGHVAVFYNYKGKSVEKRVLFGSGTFTVFFIIAELVTALAFSLLLLTIVTESLHLSKTVHHDPNYQCPTAKTGLFGGAAFLALDASLFWMVALMVALNAREDYFEGGSKGDKEGDYFDVEIK